MGPAIDFDVAVIGGGIMGCSTALNLAGGGMRTVLLERRGLCMEASGVNAGTLTHRTGPVSMQPFYTRSIAMWKNASQWLGDDVGFRERGGLTVAFNEKEAVRATQDFKLRKQQEVEIELIDGDRAREIEPNLSKHAVLASHFPRDAYANSSRTGYAFQKALKSCGVLIMTNSEVQGFESGDGGYCIRTSTGQVTAKRIVISSGAWVRKVVAMLGYQFTDAVAVRVNMMSVTERMPKLFSTLITHANSGLTLKQPDNGTVLIGGGWQGRGDPYTGQTDLVRENVTTNFRLAHSVFPGIEATRLVRTWLGFEVRLPGDEPMAGPLPGISNAFLIGGFQSGWTGGPYIGRLMADLMLGRDPELPLFDPSHAFRRASVQLNTPNEAADELSVKDPIH